MYLLVSISWRTDEHFCNHHFLVLSMKKLPTHFKNSRILEFNFEIFSMCNFLWKIFIACVL